MYLELISASQLPVPLQIPLPADPLPWNPDPLREFNSYMSQMRACARRGNMARWEVRRPRFDSLAQEAGLTEEQKSHYAAQLKKLECRCLWLAQHRILNQAKYFIEKSKEAIAQGELLASTVFFDKARRLLRYEEKLGKRLWALFW